MNRFLTLLLAFVCAATAQTRSVTDAFGKQIAIPDNSRVVAIGAGIAETVYALKREGALVGVDTSSNYPEAATKLPQVGYRKSISAEGVLALRPTLVVATDDSGPAAALEAIRGAGVSVLVLKDEPSIDGAKTKVLNIARALDVNARGADLARGIDRDLALARVQYMRIKTRPKVMFLYASNAGALTVSGTGTAANGMIGLAGGVNAVTGYTGYKPINAESVVAANPDVIVMLDRGLEAAGGVDGLLRAPGIAATNAGKSKRILTFEGTYLLGFSPRVGKAVLDLTFALHPELKRP